MADKPEAPYAADDILKGKADRRGVGGNKGGVYKVKSLQWCFWGDREQWRVNAYRWIKSSGKWSGTAYNLPLDLFEGKCADPADEAQLA